MFPRASWVRSCRHLDAPTTAGRRLATPFPTARAVRGSCKELCPSLVRELLPTRPNQTQERGRKTPIFLGPVGPSRFSSRPLAECHSGALPTELQPRSRQNPP